MRAAFLKVLPLPRTTARLSPQVEPSPVHELAIAENQRLPANRLQVRAKLNAPGHMPVPEGPDGSPNVGAALAIGSGNHSRSEHEPKKRDGAEREKPER